MSSPIIPHKSFVDSVLPAVELDVAARHQSLLDILKVISWRSRSDEQHTEDGVTEESDEDGVTGVSDEDGLTGVSDEDGVTGVSDEDGVTGVSDEDGVTDESDEDDYLEVSDETSLWIEAKRIVLRACYSHLLPAVVDKLRKGERLIVGGTPGIGKTFFGIVLVRELMLNPESPPKGVVYWDGKFATVMSYESDDVKRYGLNQEFDLNDKKIYMGSWPSRFDRLSSFLVSRDLCVVHDPGLDFTDGGMESSAKSTAIILSYGHALVGLWNTKGKKPNTEYFLPCFQKKEIFTNAANLFFDRAEAWKNQGGSLLEDLFHKFGGSIRHWGRSTENDAWEEMNAKVKEVVRNNGVGIARRSLNHRGSIVHIQVDFDKDKPIFPADGHNKFKKCGFVLGSDAVSERFAAVFQEYSIDEMKTCMRMFASEKGVEAAYGILFETYAHNVLCSSDTEVNLRVARFDGKNKNVYASTVLPIRSQRRFPGRDGAVLTEQFQHGSVGPGTYLRPESSTFPTYDALTTVPGEAVGLPDQQSVALFLQMTVSGASGLRRLPKHSVKQYVRHDLEKAVRTLVKDFEGPCITAFCVPTVCFQPFLFQVEECKQTDAATKAQPSYQFVIKYLIS